jgi:putative ABC transport system permease protein
MLLEKILAMVAAMESWPACFMIFISNPMHQKIAPMVLFMPKNARNYGKISIKISGKNIPVALSHIENTWRKFLPETPYEFTFLDENFDRLYKTEDRQKTLFTTFACIAIFIACLGLFRSFLHLRSVKE